MIAAIDREFEDFSQARCFILNEQHHVILVCSPRPGDPLNARFMPKAHANTLPAMVDKAVSILEQACERDGSDSRSATLGNMRVSVSRLHGPWGEHTTVVIEPAGSSQAEGMPAA